MDVYGCRNCNQLFGQEGADEYVCQWGSLCLWCVHCVSAKQKVSVDNYFRTSWSILFSKRRNGHRSKFHVCPFVCESPIPPSTKFKFKFNFITIITLIVFLQVNDFVQQQTYVIRFWTHQITFIWNHSAKSIISQYCIESAEWNNLNPIFSIQV